MPTTDLAGKAGAVRCRKSRKSLLVIDDEKLIRWTIREALRPEIRVRVASSAEEGLRILKGIKHLDGILADIRLPGMNGLEFVRRARATHPEAKVFLMSAHTQPTTARDAFDVHADAYLPKPFALDTLRDMVASHLGGISA